MSRVYHLWIISFLVFSTIVSQAQTKVDLNELDHYFSKMVEEWDLPSASIGIVKDDELIFTGNYGVLEEGSNEQPNEHTLYAIASNSKAFTSAMIGILVQEGKLGWDDKIKEHLPYFALYDPWVSDHTTVREGGRSAVAPGIR